MTEHKTIVCLANSRKHHGRCIAGIEIVDLQPRGWVRPVSSRPSAEVSEEERRLKDGTDPQVLDVLAVPLLGPAPARHQPENWTLDRRQYWTKTGRIGWDRLAWLATTVPAPEVLWPSQAPSTSRGLNDRVPAKEAATFGYSICLIGVADLRLQVFAPHASFDVPRRRVQGLFTYGDVSYRLWVTDPVIEPRVPGAGRRDLSTRRVVPHGQPGRGIYRRILLQADRSRPPSRAVRERRLTVDRILTVGHSTHVIDHFVNLLMKHDVTAVADVRSVPASRFTPQFNRDALMRALRDAGMQYIFLGRELGARSDDPTCYVDGRVQYERLARTSLFADGIDRLRRGMKTERIALMCSEQEPLDCHRTILVARVLAERGVHIEHIHSNGDLESHDAAIDRLMGGTAQNQGRLFEDSRSDRIAEALDRQGQRIAYVDSDRSEDQVRSS